MASHILVLFLHCTQYNILENRCLLTANLSLHVWDQYFFVIYFQGFWRGRERLVRLSRVHPRHELHTSYKPRGQTKGSLYLFFWLLDWSLRPCLFAAKMTFYEHNNICLDICWNFSQSTSILLFFSLYYARQHKYLFFCFPGAKSGHLLHCIISNIFPVHLMSNELWLLDTSINNKSKAALRPLCWMTSSGFSQ